MSDMNMALNEETLPVIDEGDLVFGAGLAPLPEGLYAVKSKLGSSGVKHDEVKQSYTIHVASEVVKALKVIDPTSGKSVSGKDLSNGQKILFKEDGTGRVIHDFIRISPTNGPGVTKAVKFLKYAGDPDYNKYAKPSQLAKAVSEALAQEPDALKVSGRWEASAETGIDSEGKKQYGNVRGFNKFPLRSDGTRSHIAEIGGEDVPAQFRVLEYGELTSKDAQ